MNNKCADQTAAPLLFTYGIDRFSHDVAQMVEVSVGKRQSDMDFTYRKHKLLSERLKKELIKVISRF